ncbi:MAG: exodeoxyribonuclease VII small subunit [Elusimicrobiota bacterium]|jgi:exodeoxyribonuclease VII small subunit
MKKNNGGPTYAAAYEELQKILEALEQGEVDVDDLSAKVKRAAELIEFCQKRLKETELEVKRVVDQFQKAKIADDDEDEDDAEEEGGEKSELF